MFSNTKFRQLLIFFLVLGFSFGSYFHVVVPVIASTEPTSGACSSDYQNPVTENQDMAPCCAEKHEGNTDHDNVPLSDLVALTANSTYFLNDLNRGDAQAVVLEFSYKNQSEKKIVLRI